MQHVKVPLAVMQEIVAVLVRLPYASVGALMPKVEALSVEAIATVPSAAGATGTATG